MYIINEAAHLERVLLGSEQPFIVTPAFNKCESSCLACRMGQCIHNILKQRVDPYQNREQPDLYSGVWFESGMEQTL
jgi:hypothetical protein